MQCVEGCRSYGGSINVYKANLVIGLALGLFELLE